MSHAPQLEAHAHGMKTVVTTPVRYLCLHVRSLHRTTVGGTTWVFCLDSIHLLSHLASARFSTPGSRSPRFTGAVSWPPAPLALETIRWPALAPPLLHHPLSSLEHLLTPFHPRGWPFLGSQTISARARKTWGNSCGCSASPAIAA